MRQVQRVERGRTRVGIGMDRRGRGYYLVGARMGALGEGDMRGQCLLCRRTG